MCKHCENRVDASIYPQPGDKDKSSYKHVDKLEKSGKNTIECEKSRKYPKTYPQVINIVWITLKIILENGEK